MAQQNSPDARRAHVEERSVHPYAAATRSCSATPQLVNFAAPSKKSRLNHDRGCRAFSMIEPGFFHQYKKTATLQDYFGTGIHAGAWPREPALSASQKALRRRSKLCKLMLACSRPTKPGGIINFDNLAERRILPPGGKAQKFAMECRESGGVHQVRRALREPPQRRRPDFLRRHHFGGKKGAGRAEQPIPPP